VTEIIQKKTKETADVVRSEIKMRATYAKSVVESWKSHIETTAVNPLLSSIGSIAARAQTISFLKGTVNEQFKEFTAQESCHTISLPRREKFTQTFVVDAGMTLFYEFAVQDMDVGMKIMLRSQIDGGSKEEEVRDKKGGWGEGYNGRVTNQIVDLAPSLAFAARRLQEVRLRAGAQGQHQRRGLSEGFRV